MQNVQDFFASTMEISLQSFYGSEPLTEPSNFTDFCEKHTQKTEEGLKRCNECLAKWTKKAERINGPLIFKCHCGLDSFAIPVIIEKKQLATVFGGKVLTSPPNKKHFSNLAQELGLDKESYLQAVEKIRILPEDKFKAIIKSLSIVVNSVANISFANFHLAAFGLNYKVPRNIALEEWLFLNCDKIKNPITTREFEVLKLIVSGKTNAEIAKELFISTHTVKAHVSTIIEKMGAQDRVQIAVKAVREGMV